MRSLDSSTAPLCNRLNKLRACSAIDIDSWTGVGNEQSRSLLWQDWSCKTAFRKLSGLAAVSGPRRLAARG